MKKQYVKSEIYFLNAEKGTTYYANPNFILREIAGEYILVPTGKELEHFNGLASLNETGKFLLEFLKEKRTLEEILKCSQTEFELTSDECWRDVSDFLNLAVAKHVILKL